MSDTGLLLVGHGTRDLAGIAEFRQLHQLLQQRAGEIPVSACFLELAEPDIPTGVQELLAHGPRRIVICPLLLFAAGHAKRDIPDAIEAALSGSGINTVQLPPLECHEQLLELSELRFKAAEAVKTLLNPEGNEDFSTGPTTLILVGRGSTDAEAQAEMHRFAELRAERQPGLQVEVCFYAMAKPGLSETLQKVANSGAQRVVVQPHLLFSGAVLEGIRRQTTDAASAAPPEQNWFFTAPLGPDPLLTDALWDLFLTAETT